MHECAILQVKKWCPNFSTSNKNNAKSSLDTNLWVCTSRTCSTSLSALLLIRSPHAGVAFILPREMSQHNFQGNLQTKLQQC